MLSKKEISLIFVIVALVALLATHLNNNNNNKSKNKKKIAIVYPLSCECIEDMKDGFIEELSKHIDVEYDIFDGSNDKILLSSQIQKIINDDYSLAYAIATSPFVILIEQTNQKHKDLPIVGASADATQLNYNNPKRNYVDVSDGCNTEDKINTLVDLYNPQRIILPYSSLPLLEPQVKHIEKLCRQKGIEFIPVSIDSSHDIRIKVEHAFSDLKEIVLILGDCFMMSNLEILVNLCRKAHKVLCTSDLESVAKGATMGYGIIYKDCGVLAAKKVVEILVHGKKAYELEHLTIKDTKVKINLDEKTYKELNIDALKNKYKNCVIWYSKKEK